MQKVHIEPLSSVKPHIVNQFRLLNCHQAGEMQDRLLELLGSKPNEYHPPKDGVVFYITGDNNKILAWALTFQRGKWIYRNKKGYYSTRAYYCCAHFYTKISERGNGFGSCLAEAVRNYYDGIVCGATTCSTIFKRFGLG